MVFDRVSPDPSHPEAGALLAGCGAAADAGCDALSGQTELVSCVCAAAKGIDHPEVCRFLPSGLDVMAVLGSGRARALLEPERRYCGFTATLEGLSAEFAAYTRVGLAAHDALPAGLAAVMTDVEALFGRLVTIAVGQLEGRAPSADDIAAVRTMGTTFDRIVSRLADVVRVEEALPPECAEGGCMEVEVVEGDPYEVRLVADVHTDVNTESVPEEGLGYLEWLVVARSMPDGSVGAGVGPVFTWHEFPHPMRDRLTDERWRELLDGGEAPGRPAWMLPLRAEP